MRAATVACCLTLAAVTAACSEDAGWEVVATFRPELTDPHDGDKCADLAGDTTKSFSAPSGGPGSIIWTVEVSDRATTDRVARCFDPLAANVEVREK